MTKQQPELLVLGIGISEHKTDGVLRFEHFCKRFNLDYRIVGEGKMWCGGDMANTTGGGQKINELKLAIENLDNKLLIICDTFDLFPVASANEIISKFNKISGPDKVLFSSEVYCWPDKKLANCYPKPIINGFGKNENKYKYLNSGSIMGYRDNIFQLINNSQIADTDDDQLFFTKKFLAGEKIVLDYNCEIFQALNGSDEDITIHKNRVYNRYTKSYPIFLHGNGSAKLFLNNLENYLDLNPKLSPTNKFILPANEKPQPKIFFALYIDSSLNNTQVFFKHVFNINWDNKIIYVYDKNHSQLISDIITNLGHSYVPNSSLSLKGKVILESEIPSITNYYFDHFLSSDADYYFLLEHNCVITNENILTDLVPLCTEYHRVISPLLKKNDGSCYTNYWGALDSNGFYSRSNDYLKLINYDPTGLWNCPYVSGAILFHRDIIANWNIIAPNKFGPDDIDMQLCYNLRRYTLFMYMCNLNEYGYLV